VLLIPSAHPDVIPQRNRPKLSWTRSSQPCGSPISRGCASGTTSTSQTGPALSCCLQRASSPPAVQNALPAVRPWVQEASRQQMQLQQERVRPVQQQQQQMQPAGLVIKKAAADSEELVRACGRGCIRCTLGTLRRLCPGGMGGMAAVYQACCYSRGVLRPLDASKITAAAAHRELLVYYEMLPCSRTKCCTC